MVLIQYIYIYILTTLSKKKHHFESRSNKEANSDSMNNIIRMMRENNFALMDIEYIEISTDHRCIRKLYILAKDGFTDFHSDFYACKGYKDLNPSHQRTFNYCR